MQNEAHKNIEQFVPADALTRAAELKRYTDLIETTRFKAMVNRQFKINLGNINHSTLKTDDDIRREARRILPNGHLEESAQIGNLADIKMPPRRRLRKNTLYQLLTSFPEPYHFYE